MKYNVVQKVKLFQVIIIILNISHPILIYYLTKLSMASENDVEVVVGGGGILPQLGHFRIILILRNSTNSSKTNLT